MKYKLIVADFDDTIYGSEMKFSPTLKDTIAEYTRAGGHFHIATGRMTSSILPKARELGMTGELLSFQGSVTTDIESGNTIKTFTISADTAEEVGKYIEAKNIYYHIYKDNCLILKEHDIFSRIYQGYCACDAIELHYPISQYIKDEKYMPVKMLIMDAPENVPGLLKEFSEKFGDRLMFNTSKNCMVEVISLDISKGKAVAWLAERLGIKREETICIGDSMNDSTMIEWAGLGVAVGNGSAAAKAVADVIAPSCEDNGVEWVIRKYGLEEDI